LNILLEFECDLKLLNNFSQKLAKKTKVGDVFFLSGDLGAGKTTFARLFINSIFDKKNINRPKNIKSPSFPIMINYSLAEYEICHYDLYRLKDKSELLEIGILEDLKNNISIIEWPDLILNNFSFTNYYLIQFEVINKHKRLLKIKHTNKNKL
tara:strand:+ start:514 stop:972 length:459 start_codon:yes stop_codon:yes gene_type:complete